MGCSCDAAGADQSRFPAFGTGSESASRFGSCGRIRQAVYLGAAALTNPLVPHGVSMFWTVPWANEVFYGTSTLTSLAR